MFPSDIIILLETKLVGSPTSFLVQFFISWDSPRRNARGFLHWSNSCLSLSMSGNSNTPCDSLATHVYISTASNSLLSKLALSNRNLAHTKNSHLWLRWYELRKLQHELRKVSCSIFDLMLRRRKITQQIWVSTPFDNGQFLGQISSPRHLKVDFGHYKTLFFLINNIERFPLPWILWCK